MVFFQDMAYLLLDVPTTVKKKQTGPAAPIPSVSAAHLPTTSAQTQPPSQMPNDSLSSPRCNINCFICIIIKTLLRLQTQMVIVTCPAQVALQYDAKIPMCFFGTYWVITHHVGKILSRLVWFAKTHQNALRVVEEEVPFLAPFVQFVYTVLQKRTISDMVLID